MTDIVQQIHRDSDLNGVVDLLTIHVTVGKLWHSLVSCNNFHSSLSQSLPFRRLNT